MLCLSEYLKYSGLAGINVAVVLGETIEPIKIVFMGVVTGSPLGHPGLSLEPMLIIMALMFLNASLQHLRFKDPDIQVNAVLLRNSVPVASTIKSKCGVHS